MSHQGKNSLYFKVLHMYREDATTWLSSRPCATAITRHRAPVIVRRIVATRTLPSTRALSTLPSTI